MPNLSAILGSVRGISSLLWAAFCRLVKVIVLIPLYAMHAAIYSVNSLLFSMNGFGLAVALYFLLVSSICAIVVFRHMIMNVIHYALVTNVTFVTVLANVVIYIAVICVVVAAISVLMHLLKDWIHSMGFYQYNMGMGYEPEVGQFLGEYAVKSFFMDCYYFFVGKQKIRRVKTSDSIWSKVYRLMSLLGASILLAALLYCLFSITLSLPLAFLVTSASIECALYIMYYQPGFIFSAITLDVAEPKDNKAIYNFMCQLYLLAALVSISVISVMSFNAIAPSFIPLISPYAIYILVVLGSIILAQNTFKRNNQEFEVLMFTVSYSIGACYLVSQNFVTVLFAPHLLSIMVAVGIAFVGTRIIFRIVDDLIMLLTKIFPQEMLRLMPQLVKHLDKSEQKKAIIEGRSQLKYAVSDVKADREAVLGAVKVDGRALQYVGKYQVNHYSEIYQHDEEIVCAAVNQDGSALKYACEDMIDTKKIVMSAVTQDGSALKYASSNMRDDEVVVRAAVASDDMALQHASYRLIENIFVENNSYKNNPDMVFALLQEGYYKFILKVLSSLQSKVTGNRDIIMLLVCRYGLALEYASDNLKDDYETVLTAVKQDYKALQYASNRLQGDKGIVLAAVVGNRAALQYASYDMKNNKELVLAVVKQNGFALQYASTDMRNDEEVVMAAITNSCAIRYASQNVIQSMLKTNSDFENMLLKNSSLLDEFLNKYSQDLLRHAPTQVQQKAIEKNTFNLQYASTDMRNDEGVVMAAVMTSGCALDYASADLKNNQGVVLAAVKQNGFALQYASTDMRNDEEVVMAAITNSCAIRYASQDVIQSMLKTNPDFENMLLQNSSLLDEFLNKYSQDLLRHAPIQVQKKSIQKDGANLQYAIANLRKNEEVVHAAVMTSGCALDYASDDLKNNQCVVLAAVKQNGYALQYASDGMKNNEEVVLAAVMKDGYALRYASDGMKDDKEVVRAAVMKYGDLLQYASDDLKDNEEVVLTAVNKTWIALNYASPSMRNNEKVVLAALWQSSDAICKVCNDLVNNMGFMVKAVIIHRKLLKYFNDNISRIIHAFRLDHTLLQKVCGSMFSEVNLNNLTLPEALLRESVLARFFFKKCKIYEKLLPFVKHLIKAKVTRVGICKIFEFIDPQLRLVCEHSPKESADYLSGDAKFMRDAGKNVVSPFPLGPEIKF